MFSKENKTGEKMEPVKEVIFVNPIKITRFQSGTYHIHVNGELEAVKPSHTAALHWLEWNWPWNTKVVWSVVPY